MSDRLLVSWVAATDYRAMQGDPKAGLGPVAQALKQGDFKAAILLNNYPPDQAKAYVRWVRGHSKIPIRIRQVRIRSPIDHAEIYALVSEILHELRATMDAPMTYHLSPGTPAMASIWLLLAKTRFPAEMIQSTRDGSIQRVELPFDIAIDFLPEFLADRDRRIRDAAGEDAPLSAAFGQITHRSTAMKRVLAMARQAAIRNVPVLIEGESGTGKELLARAIHAEGPRKDLPFVAVNCGAIPADLVESELFGHERGAFTGAIRARTGYFRAADGGTLFLDEIGELPLAAQVKLLRVLQEGEVCPVGSTRPLPVDVRIIAASHKRLLTACRIGEFRFDLFYRIAVAILVLPPLRERPGDLRLLIDHIAADLAREARDLGEPEPVISDDARRVFGQHRWPGNVRELRNTLRRAHLWSDRGRISADEARAALLHDIEDPDPLDLPLGSGFDLSQHLARIAKHYLARAMDEAGGNKTEAARLVGLASHQTLTNWLKRFEVPQSSQPPDARTSGG